MAERAQRIVSEVKGRQKATPPPEPNLYSANVSASIQVLDENKRAVATNRLDLSFLVDAKDGSAANEQINKILADVAEVIPFVPETVSMQVTPFRNHRDY